MQKCIDNLLNGLIIYRSCQFHVFAYNYIRSRYYIGKKWNCNEERKALIRMLMLVHFSMPKSKKSIFFGKYPIKLNFFVIICLLAMLKYMTTFRGELLYKMWLLTFWRHKKINFLYSWSCFRISIENKLILKN